MKPGEYLLEPGDIVANDGRATAKLIVNHTGDRPIQIGSHYHFFEVNRALAFDREAAYGMRLNIPAGTAMRFEPGEEKEVELTPFAGSRSVFGHNALVNGSLDDPSVKAAALTRLTAWQTKLTAPTSPSAAD